MNPNHSPSWPETVERDAGADRAARRERWAGIAAGVAVVLLLAGLVAGLYGLGARP